MPEHVLMSEIEIITDGGRRRHWTSADKLRIVEETLDEGASISVRWSRPVGQIGGLRKLGLVVRHAASLMSPTSS